jgi:hypothetical protein
MLITLTASRPHLAKTTQITPSAFGPIPRHRLLREGMIKASAKKASVRSRKSSRCFSRLASRFGSSQTIFVAFVYTIYGFIRSNCRCGCGGR